MALKFGGTGVPPGLRGQPSNEYALPPGTCALVPSGTWVARLGKYLSYQEIDPVSGIWRSPGGTGGFGDSSGLIYINSDGVNFRIANQTGCVVGAYPTTAGSGYTSAPTITASAGAAVFQAIIGGAVNTSITVSNGGFNYVYPPLVVFSAPPNPGLQATGYAAISAGAITGITVTDQGAGYTSAPTITIYNDPRDTAGYGGAATCVLTGAGTLTGVIATDFGSSVGTITSAPTLTITGGGGSSAAATVIMCLCLTSYTISNGGAGLGSTGSVIVTAPQTGFPATAAAYTNTTHQSQLVRTRPAIIIPTLSANAISAVGTVQDGGIYSGVNVTAQAWSNAAVVTTAVSLTAPSFTGLSDTFGLFAA